MDTQIEDVARSLCAVDGLDPDAMIAATDYADGLRAGHHPVIPQWRTKAAEAARFVAAFKALSGSSTRVPVTASDRSRPGR